MQLKEVIAAAVLMSSFAVPGFAMAADTALSGEVWKNPSCGCCKGWIAHMSSNGYALSVHEAGAAEMDSVKAQSGIGAEFRSCHTAKIGGYAIEGHVPASSVARLLREKPDAAGLAVPGMPVGSPGMDGGPAEAYDVILVKRDGSHEVFEHVPAAQQ